MTSTIAPPVEQSTVGQAGAWCWASRPLAAFMASLDLFIVNVAFDRIGADFHGSATSSLSLDPQRLRHRPTPRSWCHWAGSPIAAAARQASLSVLRSSRWRASRAPRVRTWGSSSRFRVLQAAGAAALTPHEPWSAAAGPSRPSDALGRCASGLRTGALAAAFGPVRRWAPRRGVVGAGCSLSTCPSV